MGGFRITPDTFRERAKANQKVRVLGVFVSTKDRIEAQCCLCNEILYPRAQAVLDGLGCFACGHKRRAKNRTVNPADFAALVADLHPTLELRGEYVASKLKVAVYCKVCKREWEKPAKSLSDGHGCKKCSDRIIGENARVTNEEFLDRLSKKPFKILPLSEFIGSKIKMRFKCAKCPHEWNCSPLKILSKRLKSCSGCNAIAKKSQAHDVFVRRVKKANTDYRITGKYIDSRTPVKYDCLKCRTSENESYPQTLLEGRGCQSCGIAIWTAKRTLSQKEFVARVKTFNPTITVLGQYTLSGKTVKCRCNECNGIWHPRAFGVMAGSGCPVCSKTGFDQNKPATFYVLEIVYLGVLYYGFGITGDKDSRLVVHYRHITQAGGTVIHTTLYDFDMGYEAWDLELDIKSDPNIATTDVLPIIGFRREAIYEKDFSKLLDKIEKHRHWSAVTC